jgi:hypothetical protein
MMMSSTKTFALAVMVSAIALSAHAADDTTADPPTPDRSAPALISLLETASPWSRGLNRGAPSYTSLAESGIGGEATVAAYQPSAPEPSIRPAADPSPDVYNALQAAASDTDCSSGCAGAGDCGCGNSCACGRQGFWYGNAGGLVMTRNQPNKYWTTNDQANNNFQNLNTEDANVHWDGGADFTFGYRCCGDGGIEVTYWGVWNMVGSASVTSATDSLGTPLDTTNGAAGLLLGGITPDSFFTNAHEALLWRNDQVNNIEVNFTYNPWGYDNCGWNATWLVGVRYFKFDENLLWTSVAGGFDYGDNGGADQANINVHCENDMVGVQWGAVLSYRFNKRLSVFATPKMGIYGNAAESESRYYRGDGIVGFDITGHKDTVSFVGSLDLGLNYDLGCHWSFTGGYRVVAVSGVALSDNQIPHFLAAAGEFADTKVNGDLIVHGAFLGATFRY